MEFTFKIASYEDMAAVADVEAEVFPHHRYAEDAWNQFMTTEGDMVCVYEGDYMIGIGHLQVLPDRTGWLECLRVRPSYQGRGAGKLIYQEWLRFAKKHGLKGLGMFTGHSNAVSAGLAELYGLKSTYPQKEYVLTDIENALACKTCENASGLEASDRGTANMLSAVSIFRKTHFHPVDWQRAWELVRPLKEMYHDYVVLNRTFYRINKANIGALADEGKCFEDPVTGSFTIVGTRFEHDKKLNVALAAGDIGECLRFAAAKALLENRPKLICTFAAENTSLEQALAGFGFAEGDRLVTKELVF